MPFTEQEIELLSQSCYGDLRLAHCLERMLEEGPGDDGWPEEDVRFGHNVPIDVIVFCEIFHQDTVWPSALVAIKVFFQIMIKYPNRLHKDLISYMAMTLRPSLLNSLKETGLEDSAYTREYWASLTDHSPVLIDQMRLIDDSTEEGLYTTFNVFWILAVMTGNDWTAMLLRDWPTIRDVAGSASSSLVEAAWSLGRDDLPQNLSLNNADFIGKLEELNKRYDVVSDDNPF